MSILYLEDKIAYASIFQKGRNHPERFNTSFPTSALLAEAQDTVVSQGPGYPELMSQRTLIGKDSAPLLLQLSIPEGTADIGSYAEFLLSSNRAMDKLGRAVKQRHIQDLVPSALTFAATVLANELKLNCHMLPPNGPEHPRGIHPDKRFYNEHNIRSINSKGLFQSIGLDLDFHDGTNFMPEAHCVRALPHLISAVSELGQGGQQVLLKQDISMGGEGNYLLSNEDVYELENLEPRRQLAFMQSIVDGRGICLDDGLLVQEYFDGVILNPSFEFYCYPNRPPEFVYTCQMNINEDMGFVGATLPDPYSTYQFSFTDPRLAGREKEYRRLADKLQKRAARIAGIYQELGFRGICDFDSIVFERKGQLEARLVEMNAGRETGATLDFHLLRLLSQTLGDSLLIGETQDLQIRPGHLVETLNAMDRQVDFVQSGYIATGYNGRSSAQILTYQKVK